MAVLNFLLPLFAIAFCAGFIGSLTGIGGGIIITPALVLLFGVDIHYAMGASLVALIVTSSGAAITTLKQGHTNIRIGMLLEMTVIVGVGIGALLLTVTSVHILAIIFGCVLMLSAYSSMRRREDKEDRTSSHPWATALQLESNHPTAHGIEHYTVHRVPLALSLMGMAGVLSSLLGIGSGVLKVLSMDQAMGLPYRVSTATSNFMIGITAAASVGVYLSLGYIDAALTFPIVIGVLVGAILGSHALKRINVRVLRLVFGGVVFLAASQMIYRGLVGGL